MTPNSPSPSSATAVRRRLLASSAGLLIALSGCTGSGTTDGESASAGHVEDAFGAVQITKAQRVVALSVSDADAALASGVVPVAMAEAPVEPVMPWAQDAIDGLGGETPELFEWTTEDTIPFEDIASWEPDMILATGSILGQDAYDQLTDIAPTLTTAEEGAADSWKSQTERVSKVIDQQEHGETSIEAAQSAIDQAAESHAALEGKSFLVALFRSPEEVGVLPDRDSATVRFFSELGLELDPVADEMTAGKVPDTLSLEKLDVLDSDVIVGYFPDAGLREKYEELSVFSALPAVEDGRFYQPTDEEWRGLRSVSALALPELAEPIAAKLEKSTKR